MREDRPRPLKNHQWPWYKPQQQECHRVFFFWLAVNSATLESSPGKGIRTQAAKLGPSWAKLGPTGTHLGMLLGETVTTTIWAKLGDQQIIPFKYIISWLEVPLGVILVLCGVNVC